MDRTCETCKHTKQDRYGYCHNFLGCGATPHFEKWEEPDLITLPRDRLRELIMQACAHGEYEEGRVDCDYADRILAELEMEK